LEGREEMSKNTIRKKAEEKGVKADATIVPTENPNVYQVPMTMFASELFCDKCEAGVLRPSESKIQAPTSANPQNPNAPPMIIHTCTNEDCSRSESIPFPPFPRPATIPKVDVTDPAVLGMIKDFRRQRLEFEAKKKAEEGTE
jgi:hypothetical protein